MRERETENERVERTKIINNDYNNFFNVLFTLGGEYSGVYKSMEETSDYIIDTNVINTSQTNATAELISAAKISPLGGNIYFFHFLS